ncbi:MerC domain-containing protein [Winogradskyella haliclonae]|uniref:MerC domain-containing protein n=1 Tax=Winogradskyella haliclonae TaxID=2048558 RepID=UPI0016638894|nr:MerC domain-containing protein [Winogradskyella haliclonae]
MITTKKIYWADKLGIASALLCIVHCLAAPLLMTIGVGFLNNPVIAILFILIAFVSIYKTTKRKFFKGVSILLWMAFTGFVMSIMLEERAEIFEFTMYISSLCIIIGHLYNIKHCPK